MTIIMETHPLETVFRLSHISTYHKTTLLGWHVHNKKPTNTQSFHGKEKYQDLVLSKHYNFHVHKFNKGCKGYKIKKWHLSTKWHFHKLAEMTKLMPPLDS